MLYPKQYVVEVARIQKELDAEDYGVAESSRGEKLIAARTNAYERGEMAAVPSVDPSIAKIQATIRAARNRKKTDKTAVRLR